MTVSRPLAVLVINETGVAAGVAVSGALSATLYIPERLRPLGESPLNSPVPPRLPLAPAWPTGSTTVYYPESPGERVRELFRDGNGLVLVMATGVAVRFLSGLPRDKHTDPPVVVLDTAARYAISLLSGHEGGANGLAYGVAAVVGALPVVTTGSEGQRTLAVGLGCRRGVGAAQIMKAIEKGLALAGREKAQIRVAATAEFKAHEPGIHQVCATLGVGLRIFSREAIQSVDRLFSESRCARKYFDVGGVAEPCAFLAAHQGRIILSRLVADQVTVALAEDRLWSSGSDPVIKPI